MPHIRLSLPARINILGNPGDGNEGDFATLSAAVRRFAYAEIIEAEDYLLEQRDFPGARLSFPPSDIPLPYTGELDLLKGALNRLYSFSAELRQKLPLAPFHLAAWSELPRQSGLGGSSLFVMLTLAALREFYRLDRLVHHDYLLAELAQRVEAEELGITCGYADRYVPLFGGLAYIDYRGKLRQTELFQEPLATYERFPGLENRLPLLAATTGLPHDSGDVHARMRPRYLDEHARWQEIGGAPPPMLRFMSAAWELAWRGKIALLAGDLATFGNLMNDNHRIVNEMMLYCGFTDGAGWANNLLISTALENGALGAKLTGAGSGGSVFALVPPAEQVRVLTAWQQIADQYKLEKAEFFPIEIVPFGLRVEYEA
jgi:galactokinase/mevalonate kinase-like predicted kinase